MYKCNICDKVFQSSDCLMQHVPLHVNDSEQLTCKVCQKSVNQKQHLIDHYFTHIDHKLFKCPSCGEAYRSSGGLRYHLKVCAKQKAMIDQKKRKGGLRRVKTKMVGNASVQAENINNGEIPGKQLFTENSFKCDICDRTFSNLTKLQNHKKWHSRRKCFKCQVCNRIFKHLSNFKTHKKQHGDARYIKPRVTVKRKYIKQSKGMLSRSFCKICQKQYSCLASFQRHVKEIHEGVKRPRNDVNDNFSSHDVGNGVEVRQSQKNTCRICHKNFANHNSLMVHFARLHMKKRHKCNVCGKAYALLFDLKYHYRSHGLQKQHPDIVEPTPTIREFSCYVCGQGFTQTSHLKTHCHTQHNLYDVYKCEVCAITFECRLAYKRHLNDSHGIHMKRRPSSNYQSPAVLSSTSNDALKCGKKPRFRTQSKHEVGSKTKTFKHGRCGTKFTSKGPSEHAKKPSHLLDKKHDTDVEEDHTYEICGTQLGSLSSLRNHSRIHSDQRPFQCRFCGMTFKQSGHLSSHCRKVHDEDFPYQCGMCDEVFKKKLELRKHCKTHQNEVDDSEQSAASKDIGFKAEQYTKIMISGQTEYACDYCDAPARTFKSLSALRRHVSIAHIGTGLHGVSQEKGDAKSKCSTLEMVLSQKYLSEKISPEEIYKCDICSVIVHGSEALEAHEKGHAKDKAQSFMSINFCPPVSTSMPPTPTVEQSFECKFCGEEFDSSLREAFDKHQLEHELTANEPLGMSYMCIECDKEFVMANDLIQHHSEAH